MAVLADAAQMNPEALARRWFGYAMLGVFTLITGIALLLLST